MQSMTRLGRAHQQLDEYDLSSVVPVQHMMASGALQRHAIGFPIALAGVASSLDGRLRPTPHLSRRPSH